MLPHYEYEHYYDQLCEYCEDEMVSQDERLEEGGECYSCDKTICENCREDQQCSFARKQFVADARGFAITVLL